MALLWPFACRTERATLKFSLEELTSDAASGSQFRVDGSTHYPILRVRNCSADAAQVVGTHA